MDSEPKRIDEQYLISISAAIGECLLRLYEKGDHQNPGSIELAEMLLNSGKENQNELLGSLSILYTLGIITSNKANRFNISTKYARFALRSFIYFMVNSNVVARRSDTDEEDRKFMVAFTQSLEEQRRSKLNDEPIHERDIINVIIRGTQIRNWKKTDVFLHVYHPKWHAYHLIGLGRKDQDISIDNLALRAMEIKLQLKPHQFNIDPSLKPSPIIFKDVSGSHGAITRYNIHTRILENFEKDIGKHLNDLMTQTRSIFNPISFRWFTQEEIKAEKSDNNETIMPSTSLVLNNIEPNKIPIVAQNVGHIGDRIQIINELSNRIDKNRALLYGVVSAILIILTYFSKDLSKMLESTIPFLENLSNLLTIVLAIITLVSIGLGIKNSTNFE
jgi:hypothetical protein